VGQSGAVGAQRGRVPAGQRHIAQVGEAPEAVVAAEQNLAAPDRAVRPQARPVEDDADGRLAGRDLVLGQAACQVRVMVLHGNARLRAAQGVARRQVVGVGVVGDDLRRDAEQAFHVGDAVLVGAQRVVVGQVADVLADEGVRVAGQAKGVLQLRTSRQQRRGLEGQRHRVGRVAARATQGQHAALAGADDGIIAADVNGPVVQQEGVGQRAEPGQRVVVVGGDWLLAEVAAGHDQGGREAGRLLQQQVVQRRVGQHHA